MSIVIRKKILSNGKKSLYLDLYVNGVRKYEFLKLYLLPGRLKEIKELNKETLRLAEKIKAKRQIEIDNYEHGFIPSFNRNLNFIEYFEKLSNRDGSFNWSSTLAHLKNYTGGFVKIGLINEKWLEDFQKYLLSKVKNNTANLYYTMLKTALKQAETDKLIPKNPSNNVRNIQKLEAKREFLTLDEIKRLNKTGCKYPDIKRAFLFSCYSGLRYSDMKELTWQQIHENKLDFRQRKTKAMEYLPLNQIAIKLLENGQIKAPEGKIFNLPSLATINTVLKDWCHLAGIEKKITYHCSRHTFATLSLTSGSDLYTVSKLLGHTSIEATQIYGKIIDEKKKQAVDNLPDFE